MPSIQLHRVPGGLAFVLASRVVAANLELFTLSSVIFFFLPSPEVCLIGGVMCCKHLKTTVSRSFGFVRNLVKSRSNGSRCAVLLFEAKGILGQSSGM